MKVLSISDVVVPHLYDPGVRKRCAGVDLILGCGDLPYYYLEYLVSLLNVPCFFVAGNHDAPLKYDEHGMPIQAPAGCTNLDDRVVREKRLWLAGLEGSIRYNDQPYFQYTETEMWFKILGMVPRLVMNRLAHGYYLDVLITHSPPYSIHDDLDRAHQGFRALLRFMDWFRPRYLIHGHTHVYRSNMVTVSNYRRTQVVNTYGFRILDIEPRLRKTKDERR
jgi:Icc-related predicted phosphoesterase